MNWNKYSDEQLKACASGCMKQTAYFIILLVSIIWLSSCKTKEYVYVEKTDTMYVAKHDTVKDVQIKWQRYDSIVHDSVSIQLGDDGKPTTIEKWHKIFVKDYIRDSVDKYKAKYDSLQSVKNKVETKEKVITKTNYSGWWAFGGLLLLGAAVIFLVWKLKSK